MAFNDAQTLIPVDRANDRDVGIVFNDCAQFGLMPGSTELIEDDAGNVDIPVECLVAQDQGCDTARHAARIDH